MPRERQRLALRRGDGGQQSIVGAVVGEALAGAGAQSEINAIGADQDRHAFGGNSAGESGFHFAE